MSVAQLIASADTSGEALRLLRAAMNLTQADLVARADGAIGADQISLIERGKRPMTSKQCTVIAQALHLTDADEAQLMLLAQTDRAPERLKPLLHQVRLRSMLSEGCVRPKYRPSAPKIVRPKPPTIDTSERKT